MANPHPDEKALFDKISNEKLLLRSSVWDLVYSIIGENISAVNLLVSFYVEENKSIPVEEARKILLHTRKISVAFRDLIYSEVPKTIKELFGHYVGNDLNSINMIVSFCLDPLGEEPVPVKESVKILKHSRSIAEFVDKLRSLTWPA